MLIFIRKPGEREELDHRKSTCIGRERARRNNRRIVRAVKPPFRQAEWKVIFLRGVHEGG